MSASAPCLPRVIPLLDRAWLEKSLGLSFPRTMTVGAELSLPGLCLVFRVIVFPRSQWESQVNAEAGWDVQYLLLSLSLLTTAGERWRFSLAGHEPLPALGVG